MEWGWNPSTLQAAGGIATAGAMVAIIVSTIFQVRSTRIAAREARDRTRPWLGLVQAERAVEGPFSVNDILGFHFENSGVLPAQNCVLRGTIRPVPDTTGHHWTFERAIGAIPPSDRLIWTLEAAAEFERWISEKVAALRLDGKIYYESGQHRYLTEFVVDVIPDLPVHPRLPRRNVRMT